MAIFNRFRRKRRKYPIRWDEYGKSARSRCFEMFEDGIPLREIAETVGVKIDTVHKYHQQWKKNPNFEKQYVFFKGLLKKTAPDRDNTISLLAKTYGIEKQQLDTILSQPHGLRRLMAGKFYFPGHADADHKRYVALEVAFLISEHLIENRGKFEDVYFAFQCWMQENLEYRKDEEEKIKKEDLRVALIRAMLQGLAKKEREGRPTPEKLTDEERNAILRYGLESLKKRTEINYWYSMAGLIAQGHTLEEAREKAYQDVLKSGNIEGARELRAYQDIIHPLKTDGQVPPDKRHKGLSTRELLPPRISIKLWWAVSIGR